MIRLPRIRMALLIIVGGAMLSGILLYRSYEYVQHDPRFCVSCHTMAEPFKQWGSSPHHMVDCHECHQQNTKEKLRQAWMYITLRPDAVVHHPDLNHAICAKCHLSNDPQWKLVGETAGHKVHFEKAGIDCLDCHMGGVHEFLRPTEVCGKCHADKVDMKNKMAFVHCTQCHNFLAKGEGAAGIMPTREHCLKCHEKIKVESETFPTKGPMHNDCGTCHKPHGQIRLTAKDCLACHADLKSPPHDAAAKADCIACHKPHSWSTKKSAR